MAPKVAGKATGMALRIPGVDLDRLDVVMGTATADYRAGQIADVTIPLLDRDETLAPSLNEGALAFIGDDTFQIAAQERDYRAEGLALTLSLRSGLAQQLRDDKGPRTTKGVTPKQWIERRVKAAGGTAVVQSGAKQRVIVQKRNVSALAVIEDLASDTNTTWVEHSNTLYVGTPYWAYQGEVGLPTWELPLSSTAALGFAARNSKSDDTNSATASLTVPNEVARKLRPWHRIIISSAAPTDNGAWLIEGVTFPFDRSPGEIELTRPRKSSVQNGSSSTADGDGNGGNYEGYDGPWVPGADKIWRQCNKTPREIVALALKEAQNRVNWGSGNCLNWVSHVCTGSPAFFGGSGGHGGLYARYVWDNKPAGTPSGPDRNAPAGSLVVWRHNSIGHIAIAVGNGKMVTTNNGPVQLMDIGAYMGWGGYAGWMAPNFYQ